MGARVHAEPRKRLYDHATHLKNHRLSVTLTEESAPGIILKDDEACTSRPRTRMPASWCGLTLFYEADHTNEFFIDTPAGLLKMELTTDAEEDVREVYACWASRQEPDYVNEIYALIRRRTRRSWTPSSLTRTNALLSTSPTLRSGSSGCTIDRYGLQHLKKSSAFPNTRSSQPRCVMFERTVVERAWRRSLGSSFLDTWIHSLGVTGQIRRRHHGWQC